MSKYVLFWVGLVPLVCYVVRYEKEIQKEWSYFLVAIAYLAALTVLTRFMARPRRKPVK